MSKKKLLMIFLLILFIIAIGAVVFAVNKKATENQVSNKEENKSNEVIEITDNLFIEQTNDIFYNSDDYINKTIKMAGLIYPYKDPQNFETYYAVIRNTPGCCGNDGLAGLDIRYDGEYPEKDTWVEVEGTLKMDEVNGEKIPAIYVTSLKETEEGVTFVTN